MPCESSASGVSDEKRDTKEKGIFLAITYDECMVRPVRVMPESCSCDEMVCEYSRIREGYKIACLTNLPDSHKEETNCPFDPTDGWIVLAKITVPITEEEDSIDHNVRKTLRQINQPK